MTRFFDEVVLEPGDKTPMKKLEDARKIGLKLEKAGKAQEAIEQLAPLLAAFAVDPDPKRDTVEDHEELVADAWNLLGVFHETTGELPSARAAYSHAAWWGAELGATNYDWLKRLNKSAFADVWPMQRKQALSRFKQDGIAGYDAAALDAVVKKRLGAK